MAIPIVQQSLHALTELNPLAGARLSRVLSVGSYVSNAVCVLGDLKQNRLLQGQLIHTQEPLLILYASRKTSQSEQILRNVALSIFRQKHFFQQFSVDEIRTLYKNHMSLERSFLEDDSITDEKVVYYGFILERGKLYALHSQETKGCYLFREGRLLEFLLRPSHFITIQPGDLLMMTEAAMMNRFIQARYLQTIWQQCYQSSFQAFFKQNKLAHFFQNATGPFVALQLNNKPEVVSGSLLHGTFTKKQWMQLVLVVLWMALLAGSFYIHPGLL